MLSGGYLKDIPKPHRRRWPDDTEAKRCVHIRCAMYSVGVHYWVSLEEEDNPLWNSGVYNDSWGDSAGTIIGWQIAWDDEDARGRRFEKQTKSFAEAQHFARKVMAEHFPPDQYYVTGEAELLAPRVQHLYRHEGD